MFHCYRLQQSAMVDALYKCTVAKRVGMTTTKGVVRIDTCHHCHHCRLFFFYLFILIFFIHKEERITNSVAVN